MSFKYLQGWWLNLFPRQSVPMLGKPFSEEIFPNIQSKSSLAQLEANEDIEEKIRVLRVLFQCESCLFSRACLWSRSIR